MSDTRLLWPLGSGAIVVWCGGDEVAIVKNSRVLRCWVVVVFIIHRFVDLHNNGNIFWDQLSRVLGNVALSLFVRTEPPRARQVEQLHNKLSANRSHPSSSCSRSLALVIKL